MSESAVKAGKNGERNSVKHGGGVGSEGRQKKSSFQITSVTATRMSNDGGDDSADDLDESHTDDISRVTEGENETPSFSEDTFSKDDVFFNPGSTSLGSAPVIPTSSQYGLALVPTHDAVPAGAGSVDVINIGNVQTNEADRDTQVTTRNERFKVVKIESTEPFKRGRWQCMDYLDHAGFDEESHPGEQSIQISIPKPTPVPAVPAAVAVQPQSMSHNSVPNHSTVQQQTQSLPHQQIQQLVNQQQQPAAMQVPQQTQQQQTSPATMPQTVQSGTGNQPSINPSAPNLSQPVNSTGAPLQPNPVVAPPSIQQQPASQPPQTAPASSQPQIPQMVSASQSQPTHVHPIVTATPQQPQLPNVAPHNPQVTNIVPQAQPQQIPTSVGQSQGHQAQSLPAIPQQQTQLPAMAPQQQQPIPGMPPQGMQQQLMQQPMPQQMQYYPSTMHQGAGMMGMGHPMQQYPVQMPPGAYGQVQNYVPTMPQLLPQQMMQPNFQNFPQQPTSTPSFPNAVTASGYNQSQPVMSYSQPNMGYQQVMMSHMVPQQPVPPAVQPEHNQADLQVSVALLESLVEASANSDQVATNEDADSVFHNKLAQALTAYRERMSAARMPQHAPSRAPSPSPSASGTSAVAIDNKIEQAMDLVKSHLMFAVREEVEVLREKIAELMERINGLEMENTILKTSATQEVLASLQQQVQAAKLQSAPANPPN